MSVKRRLNSLAASLPPDPAQMCCLNFERATAYTAAIDKRFNEGPMQEAPPEFLPACLKGPTPCPEGHRYACAVWRNVARCEHLRDLPAELFE